MGQYFKAIVKDNDNIEVYDAWTFQNGAKFLEHAYLRNEFTNFIMAKLLDKPAQLAWVGDYSDGMYDTSEFHQYYHDKTHAKKPSEEEIESVVKPITIDWLLDKIVLNHTKQEVVVFSKLPDINRSLYIHPICVLTAQGLGLGGGDFIEKETRMSGAWCGDLLEVKSISSLKDYAGYDDITENCYFEE